MKKIKIVTVVWDKIYNDLFLEYMVPSLTSKMNLGNKDINKYLEMNIYTGKSDIEYLNSHENVKKLRSLVNTRVVGILDNTDEEKFNLVNIAHEMIIHESDDYDGLIIIYPDSPLSDGAITNIFNKAQNHGIIYNIVNLRVNIDQARDHIHLYQNLDGGYSSDSLVNLLLRFPHDIFKSYNGRAPANSNPCILVWKANPTCLVCKSIHQYPIYVDKKYLEDFKHRYENHKDHIDIYLLRNGYDEDDCYVFTDSDDIVMIDLTFTDPKDFKLDQIYDRPINRTYHILSTIHSSIHKDLRPLNKTFILHSTNVKTNVEETIKEAEQFVKNFYIKNKMI